MTAGDDGETPLLHKLSARKRKRRGIHPAFIYVAAAIAVGAGLWFFLLKEPSTPLWLLPEGRPSMSDAQRCFEHKDWECAESDLLAYNKKYPNDSQGVALLAIALHEDGRHEQAIFYCRKAIAMGVDAYDLEADCAKSYDSLGQLAESMKMNRMALKNAPTLVDVRGTLADQLVRQGKKKEAVELLEGFDRDLEERGYTPYFRAKIDQIKLGMGGEAAKEAKDDQAAENGETPKAQPGETIVKGEPMHGNFAVQVSVDGSDPMSFMVDSGAGLVSIPEEAAAPLFKAGRIKQGDYRGTGVFMMANGNQVLARIYVLRSIKVGGHEERNVLASVYEGHGPRLLGQSFLKRFKSWSIDNRRGVLVLTN
jgi:clan AA aspartic protease (TIGR02281 family)